RVLLSPDAMLRAETVDSVLDRILAAVRPPSAAAAANTPSA
ncbi:MAG: hypothetical protein QOE64_1713, partial [Frankiales bacterium]|nr:hypothetical protein [Frankiales bacterium]